MPALHRIYGVPAALNGGNWLYFWAFVSRLRRAAGRGATGGASPRDQHAARVSLRAGAGPGDSRGRNSPPEDRRGRTRGERAEDRKPGRALDGARRARGRRGYSVVEAAIRFGRDVGVGVQMLDDLSGIASEARKQRGARISRKRSPPGPGTFAAQFDASTFVELSASLDGLGSGAPPEPLLRTMRARWRRFGKERVREHLDRTLSRFASALPGDVRSRRSVTSSNTSRGAMASSGGARAGMRRRALVIGSGFGGLAAAIRLQAAGVPTVLYEARDKPGGRAYVYASGFTFDAGPTVITAPNTLEELFTVAGRRWPTTSSSCR